MIEIKGKYCKDCVVFTDNIEPEALSMVYNLCECPAFKDAHIRIMPDVHAGKGITIGFSCPVGDFVDPTHIGVDIGCQMTSMELNKCLSKDDYVLFEQRIKNLIPTGFEINTKRVFDEKDFYKFMTKEYNKARSSWAEMIPEIGRIDEKYLTALCKRVNMDLGTFLKSIGSLGGGNHFIEYGETDDGRAFFTVHCGSRNFGVKVCNYWSKIAKRTPRTSSIYNVDEEIKKLKATEPDRKKWHSAIEAIKEHAKTCNPQGYLSGENLKGYLSDMVIATAYAKYNHKMIMDMVSKVLQKFAIKEIDRIVSVHNYIDFSDHIIRKGAIRSYEGEKMIIPFNMRDGIAICEGKSNEDWNCTAPHGAGRIMSRSAAKKNVSLEDFKESMKDVYSTSVCEGTLDESPMVYKPMQEIVDLIQPTANILFFIRPRINIKATDGED